MDNAKQLTRIVLLFFALAMMVSCSTGEKPPSKHEQPNNTLSNVYSNFGPYQALPEWSGWCPVNANPDSCTSSLFTAVKEQTSSSRPTVRAHGWQLWAAISSPLANSGFDSKTQTSNKFGTSGCWAKDSQKKSACSGVFPLWLSWPNTGLPHGKKPVTESKMEAEIELEKSLVGLIKISRSFSEAKEGKSLNAQSDPGIDPDPTEEQTVNTVGTPIPIYQVPAIAITKQCGIPKDVVKPLLEVAYSDKSTDKEKLLAWKSLDDACIVEGHPGVVCPSNSSICDGSAFVNQGDVMIATESLTEQAWNSVQKNKLYKGTMTLSKLYEEGKKEVAAKKVASWFNKEFISTKHMFWPVKGCKPGVKVGEKGCRVRYGALPPWVPAKFKDKNYASNAQYLGYEKWGKVVAIDSCGDDCAAGSSASLKLSHVQYASAITTSAPSIYSVKTFQHLQVSEETLNKAFTATDRALLDQATVWAYGDESYGFEAGDFLVVVAMHVITKEIDTWGFQSVWWSPVDDNTSDCPVTSYNHCFGQTGAYKATNYTNSGLSKDKVKTLDGHVGTTWRDHYLLTDSYGIRYEIDGSPVKADNYFSGTPPKWATQRPNGEAIGMLPVAMNPYIEPVIHPLGTNCQNCHRRAGAPSEFPKAGEYKQGVGRSNYQNSQCPNLLGDYGMPGEDPCMLNPWAWNQNAQWDAKAQNNCQQKDGTLCKSKAMAFPIVNTDFSWFVADGHVQGAEK